MKKQDNRLAFLVLATLTTGIGLIYTLIMYHDIFFAVVGMSTLFLITAFILTQNIITFATMKNKSLNVQIRDCVDGISNQLEAMNGVQAQIGKATFLYTRKAAESVATLENNYSESQETLYKNLVSLSNAHNKATKLMIKYDQSNTTKVISTIKDLRSQLSDAMLQGLDQLQPDNTEVVDTLSEIVDYLKSQSGTMDQAMGEQLTNIAQELQNMSNNIQKIQFVAPEMPQPMAQSIPVTQPVEVTEPEMAEPTENILSAAADIQEAEETPDISMTETVAELSETDVAEQESDLTESAVDVTEPESDLTESAVEVAEPEAAPTEISIPKDPNAKMSDDEIAALFAASDPAPKKEPGTPDDTPEETEEAFTPTFTVVGKSDEEEEEAPAEEETSTVATIGDLGNDPNKQLSPDEIAALFASAEPAPKKPEKTEAPAPAAEPAATPVSDDPNKQLSPDEIAALFASAEPAPKKEPVKVEPVSADPNKQLSPDEIAALFASMG